MHSKQSNPNEPGDDTHMHLFEFAVWADYYQVYLDDCQLADERNPRSGQVQDPKARLAALDAYIAIVMSPKALTRQLGLAPGTLCIFTARNLTVPLTVQIRADAPADDITQWDHIVEAHLDVPSGCIVVHGPSDYFPAAPRIAVAPGVYRVRVYYGGLSTVSADGLEGEDHYCVALWPEPTPGADGGPDVEPIVLYTRATIR